MHQSREDQIDEKGGDSEEDDNGDPGVASRPAKKKRINPRTLTCPHCGKKGHSTTRSKHCLHYKDKNNSVAPVATEPTEDDNQSIDPAEDLDRYEGLLLEATGTEDANNNSNDQEGEVQVLPT